MNLQLTLKIYAIAAISLGGLGLLGSLEDLDKYSLLAAAFIISWGIFTLIFLSDIKNKEKVEVGENK